MAENLPRHLATEELWFAHDYVPFEQGENFAFLGGRDWEPSEVTLPKHITDALEILLITKDNLAGYHRELVEHFILDEKWGRWSGPLDRRGAPARRRAAQLPRRDPRDRPLGQRGRPRRARDEGLPRRHVQPDRDAGVHGVLRARARRVLPQSRGADRRARAEVLWSGRIATDEERHEEFFAQPGRALPDRHRATRPSPRSPSAPRVSGPSAATSTPMRTRCAQVAEAGHLRRRRAAHGDLRPHRAVGSGRAAGPAAVRHPVVTFRSRRAEKRTRRARG